MYTIHPIQCATLTSYKDSLTYKLDREVKVEFPVLSFLVTADDPDDDTVILVDTGVKEADDDYIVGRDKQVGPPGGGPDPLVDGLAEQGLAPADVDHVIITHLHHDHTSNNELFTEAEFLVQRGELEAFHDPIPLFANTCPEDNVAALEEMDVTVTDGDYRLREGIELLLTPGHTEAMQSVVVQTAACPHALIADLAYSKHNLDPSLTSITDAAGQTLETTPVDYDYCPPGTLVDVAACYDSIARLRDRVGPDGVLLPGHDAELADRYPVI